MDPLHATEAIWHDPLSYDYLKDGPPYLPGLQGGRVASGSGSLREWVRTAADQATDVKQAFVQFMAEYADAPMAELAVLLASIRAEAMIHQAHHWQTRGQTYYADHLLFERVYNEVNGFVDGIAERAVGAGQEVFVQPLMQISHMVAFGKMFYSDAPVVPDAAAYPVLSLRALLKSAVMLRLCYDSLECRGLLTNGTDNLLQGIADKQEELMYLLKQRTKTREANMTPRTALDAFKHEILVRRVASRFMEAMEHDSPEALKKYLHDHPGADKSKHTVKKKDDDKGGGEKELGGGEAKKPAKKRHPDVHAVMKQHDLKDEDADELEKFKKNKPMKGKPLSDAQLMQKFLAKASPETKERMKGMSVGDFKKMYAAIMDEEGGEG